MENMNKNIVKNNSDLYILFDAKLTNPNGNIDDENKPRIDEDLLKALMTDVCWKRNIRDYVSEFYNQILFCKAGVSKVDRIKELGVDLTEKEEKIHERILDCFDARVFGYCGATKDKNKDSDEEDDEEKKSKKKGKNKEGKISFSGRAIGPVQFNIGESLNPVEIVSAVSTITCVMPDTDDKGQPKDGNSIGKDYRLNYALFGISGTVNARNAAKTGMTEEDLALVDDAIINALNMKKTHSKMGQKTRLYVRIEYNHPRVLNNDFIRNYMDMKYDPNKKIDLITDYSVDITRFVDLLLKKKANVIQTVHVYHDPLLKLVYNGQPVPDLAEFLKGIGLPVRVFEDTML